MPNTPIDAENVSPYKLLENFSKNRVMPCILLALLIHVAVIGGLSTQYIYTTWINPAADQEATDDADQPQADKDGEKPDTAAASEEGENVPPADGDKPADDDSRDDNADDEGKAAPVIQRVTDTEDPENIPDDPDGPGISLDD